MRNIIASQFARYVATVAAVDVVTAVPVANRCVVIEEEATPLG